MNNLTVRVLFALFAMPTFAAAAYAGKWGHLGIMMLLTVGGAWEYARMVQAKYPLPGVTIVSVLATIGMTYTMGVTHHASVPLSIFALGLFLIIGLSFKKQSIEEIFPSIAIQGFGLFFFGIWTNLSMPLFNEAWGWKGCLAFLFVATSMWACDSGAYFAGKFLGKRKMCPQISPKKTWEGAIGGAISCLVWAYFVGAQMLEVPQWAALVIGLLLSVTAPIGDLLFSCMKRYTGIKDSSNIFPGHGGVLDRFDSLFLSAPVVALLLLMTKEYL